ncbi:MAG TPA: hypothetical protein VK427_14035 [Kofleriaceae bacterium]|nr:hypothetical protein [Kofleriaceae bacterium]
MTTQQRSLPLVALVLAAVVLVFHAPLVAGGKTWADLRYHTDIAPARFAAADAVRGGELPGWWDGSGLGVPLAAEPSHGALYPLTWLASSTRALDLVTILHFLWAALGIAVWARRRGASEPAAVVVAALVVASGLFGSLAVRGALPAIAQLPWIGAAATWLVDAQPRRARVLATVGLAVALGAAGLTGVFAALVDGIVIALVIAGRRRVTGYLAIAILSGLAISLVQWLPALLFLGHGAGDTVHGLAASRLLELVVPGSFGGDGEHVVPALAGKHAWAPSLFVGAALLALAAIRAPGRRLTVIVGSFAVLAGVVGRGGWPAWLGAPELHLAALIVVLAVHASQGLDDLLAGKRRAVVSLAVGVVCTAVALAALVVLRRRAPDAHVALDRALVDGAIAIACAGLAALLAWRARAPAAVLVLLLLSSAGVIPSTSPTIERGVVDEPQVFATAAMAKHTSIAPLRIFRPVYMGDEPHTLEHATSTLAHATPSRWGLAAVRSEDPARLPIHDRAWLAAAREGGALLDRFGIELAILPATVVDAQRFEVLATRGSWVLVALPVAPVAAVQRGVSWSADAANTLDLMFPPAGGIGVLRGTVVLEGRGPARLDRGPPLPCAIERWAPGSIDLQCTSEAPGFAAISSTPAPGWAVTVDDRARDWYVADVLRRAVEIDAGTHQVAWRYATPGLTAGLAIAALAVLGLLALYLANRR